MITSKPIAPELRFPEFQTDGAWEVRPLGKLAPLQNRKIEAITLSKENYVSTENLLPGYAGIKASSNIPNIARVTQFKEGDILSSNIRPYLKKVWRSDRSGGASNDVLIFRAKKQIQSCYLGYILKNDDFISFVMESAKGVKMPRGDIEAIEEYPVSLPPDKQNNQAEQQKIAECLSSLDDLIAAQDAKITALGAHKKGLMQKLFPKMDEAGV